MADIIANDKVTNLALDKKASESSTASNASNTASIFSSVAGTATSLLGISTTMSDIKNSNQVLSENLTGLSDSVKWSQGVRQQQRQDLARNTSDTMSAIGFEAMVAEATAVSASTESGTTGTSQQEQIAQVFMEENFAKAGVQRDYKMARADSNTQALAELLNLENEQDKLLSQQLDPMNAAMKVASAGFSGFSSGQKLFS